MELAYGKSKVKINLPTTIEWQILQKNLPSLSKKYILQNGIKDLLEQLSGRVKDKDKILLIVPDLTRKCRLDRILPLLINEIVKQVKVTIEILVANGSHTLQPDSEIKKLVGEQIFHNIPVYQHDSTDQKCLYFAGKTSYGTKIWLNNKIQNCDLIITISSMVFHYFAGFGGGPKLICPGIAGYETIRENHKKTINPLTGQFNPLCAPGNIDSNPVYLDLKQALDFLPNVLSLQVVLDQNGDIAGCIAGPVCEAQHKLVPKVFELSSLAIKSKADIIIASAGGFPADINMIQVHKAIYHSTLALKENGILVLFAECSQGIGSNTFFPYFKMTHSSDIAKALLNDYKINGQTALSLKEKTEKYKIILISRLEKKVVKRTGMIPAEDFDSASGIVRKMKKKENKGYIVTNASFYIPFLLDQGAVN